MKTIWKVLGAALAVGLTPYKVEKNEETGERSYQSLLLRITSAPGSGENQRDIGINLGEGTLTAKLLSIAAGGEEPHLFSDELCVEYTGTPVTGEPAETAEPEEAAETAEETEPVEAEAPVEEEEAKTEEGTEEA